MTQPHFIDGQWQDPEGLIDTFSNGRSQLMAVAALERVTGSYDNQDETCNWIEYRLGEDVVHRSVDMRLKKAIFADGVSASFS